MNYNLKGTDLSITPEIRAYLEKKLASLDKFVSTAARADVELGYLPQEEKTYRAEVMLHDPQLKSSLRAEARAAGLHEAIDIAAAELFRELTQIKKKKLQVFRRSAVRVKEYLRGWRGNI